MAVPASRRVTTPEPFFMPASSISFRRGRKFGFATDVIMVRVLAIRGRFAVAFELIDVLAIEPPVSIVVSKRRRAFRKLVVETGHKAVEHPRPQVTPRFARRVIGAVEIVQGLLQLCFVRSVSLEVTDIFNRAYIHPETRDQGKQPMNMFVLLPKHRIHMNCSMKIRMVMITTWYRARPSSSTSGDWLPCLSAISDRMIECSAGDWTARKRIFKRR
ncbi:hypothetical protein K438DRAFT_1082272 [Mycena galopus ATCC 62051]|nr:hypothetical protein K438DRAFT_1082272 [Mycena galopus ATCC 62051]